MSSPGSKGIAIALVIPIAIAGVALYPFLHNQYVHPLGRLARSIVVGARCDDIRNQFDNYARSIQSPVVRQNESTISKDLLLTKDVLPSQSLNLYDESVFDDLQLRVRCDPENQFVVEKLFVGD